MAASVVKEYIKDASSLTTSGNLIVEAVEAYWVQLQSSDWANGATSALYAAINAPGLPFLWSAHPTIPDLSAVQYTPEPWGRDKCIVKVRYVNSSPQVVLRGGCALETIQTDMDVDKRPIRLIAPDLEDPVPGVVTALRARPCFVAQRIVADEAYGGINPVEWQNRYADSVNADSVQVRGVTFPAGSLLCENFGFDNDGLWGVAWNIVVEMRGNPHGFNPEVALLDPETGEPYDGLVKDPNFNKINPLERICVSASDGLYGRKVIREQREETWGPLMALFA